MNIRIADIAYHLPERVDTGEDILRDNPGWPVDVIEAVTGITERRIAAEGETALDLGAAAAEKLFSGGVDRSRVDALVLVTRAEPAHALQARLALPRACLTFSVNVACSGFVHGLGISAALLQSGLARSALLVCSDIWSSVVDPHDRACRGLFGDGAAATLVMSSEEEAVGPFVFGSDGNGAPHLTIRRDPRCAHCDATTERLFMDGTRVLLFTMTEVPLLVGALLDKARLRADQVDLFVFHQASQLVLDNLQRRLGLPAEKVVRNYRLHGNTVAATIPIALRDAADEGRLKPGDTVLIAGFGAGYAWGGAVVKWCPGWG